MIFGRRGEIGELFDQELVELVSVSRVGVEVELGERDEIVFFLNIKTKRLGDGSR